MVSLEAATYAIQTIFSWPVIAYVVLGVLIGMVFGAIPGLGGTIAIALLIPMTLGIPAEHAFPLFLATLSGVAFGGSISAILANIPGTTPNAATLIDGYPMSQQGRASEALGVSATASALGALFGVIVLTSIIPFARQIILSFGPPEFFWIVVAGLAMIAVVGKGNMHKSVISGFFGIMVGLIGFQGHVSTTRFTGGLDYLWVGIAVVPALIGLFAIAEVIRLMTKGGTIASEGSSYTAGRRGTLRGVVVVLKNPRLVIQSSLVGVIVGMIPGAGGSIASFLAYGQGAQTARGGNFGEGDARGVLAAEAANDAKDGGALIPTIVFGIPGSVVMVVLLAALLIHGLAPGANMLDENLPFLYTLIAALIFGNVLTSILGLMFANHLAKLTRVPAKVLVGPILMLSLTGAWAMGYVWLDVLTAVLFGFVGYLMFVTGYSRVAFLLGIILGPIADKNLIHTLLIWDTDISIFFTRPISIILILMVVLSVLYPVVKDRGLIGRITS